MSHPIPEAPGFEDLVDPAATIECLGGDCTWAEGPAWLPGRKAVIWSDVRNNRIMRWSEDTGVEVEREAVEFTNGRALDGEGRVVVCSQGRRTVEREEPDGTITTLASHYRGRRLNSPNDVVVKSDGTVWFSDPPYGILSNAEGHAAEPDLPGCYVFRLDPGSGDLTVVVDSMGHPNGLAFSPDESVLYVSDTLGASDPAWGRHLMAFDVVGDSLVTNARVFAEIEPGVPDGLRVDKTGHVFTSSGNGIQVYDPTGRRLGRIPVPEVTSNCVFGGEDGSTLFITATTSLYRVQTLTTGSVSRPS